MIYIMGHERIYLKTFGLKCSAALNLMCNKHLGQQPTFKLYENQNSNLT